MAVNLNGIDLSSGTPLQSQTKPSSSQVPQPSSQSSAAPQSEVSITSTAALLANVQQTLSSLPAIDQNRVDAISKAIESGTYQVDPDKVAGGLIRSERDLAALPSEL